MHWARPAASLLVLAIVIPALALAVSAEGAVTVALPELASVAGPASDLVPERWVVGVEAIEGQHLTIAERLRVLPGARLVVNQSTLTFAAHAAGLTGIVAEPGSEVAIVGSTVQGPEGSFVVHLEGQAVLDQATVRGAARVVLQPRAWTDHVDEAAGAQLERQVPGWRAARALTQASALVRGSLVEGPGPALVAAVPVQYDATAPPTQPALRIVDSTVRATGAGGALVCYVTRQAPDPDRGLPVPLLAGDEGARFEVVDSVLEANGGAALRCPPEPAAYALPARNLPLADPGLAAPMNDALPEPPSPEAEAGPAVVALRGGIVRGAGVGVLLDGVADLDAQGTAFDGLDVGVRVDSVQAAATVRDALGSGLGTAFEALDGDLIIDGGDLAGDGTGVGLLGRARVDAQGLALRGFATGIDTRSDLTFAGGSLEGMAVCARITGASTLEGATLRSCGAGVVLDRASGGILLDNAFVDNADPLRVLGTERLHFQHQVAGNTVNGRSLAYLFERARVTVEEPVGHLVVAFSSDVAFTDLDLAHGGWQVVGSDNVALGATIGKTAALLARTAPEALAAWDRVGPGVRFEQYEGALRGPQGTLDEGVGNALDQSWALAQLLRDAGRPARFVDGSVRIDTDAYLNWVGMEHAGFAFGLPGFEGTWFGSFAVMDHTWVEAQVAQGLWVALDPSFEQYDRRDPLDVAALAGVDLEAPFEAGGLAPGVGIDYGTHSIARVHLDDAMNASEDNRAAVQAFLDARPGLTALDLLGGALPRAIAPEEELSARALAARFDSVPVQRQWSVRIRTQHPSVSAAYEAEFWGTTPSVYGQKFNVESAPSDETEAAQLEQLGGYYLAPRHDIELTTYFFLGDRAVAADGAVLQPDGTYLLPDTAAQRPVHRHPGDLANLVIEVRAPGNVTFQEKHSAFRVGGTYAVALSIGRVSQALVDREAAELQASIDLLRNGPTTTLVPTHMLMGAMYALHGLSYFGMVQGSNVPMARAMDVLDIAAVDVAVTGTSLVPVYAYNPTLGATVETTYSSPPYIDVQGRSVVVHEQGDRDKAAQYLFSATVHGSNMEDKVFAGLYSTPSVSTVKVLNAAMAQGQRIYHLNDTEFYDVWPHIQALPDHVLQSILDAVNRGMDVVTPGAEVTYLDWTGVGWIEYDASTGASGFLISGGTAPPTNAGLVPAPLEPVILNGGSGARFIGFSDNPDDRFDWGYLYGDTDAANWGKTALGAVLDWGEAQTYQAYMDASKTYRGKALNNAQRALAGSIDLPVKTARFLGTAGIVLDVGAAGIEIADVWMNPDLSTRDQVITTGGIVALTGAEVVVGGVVVAKGAAIGAAIGAIGDGPGVVIGAVVGGAVAAVATGLVFDGIKKFLFG